MYQEDSALRALGQTHEDIIYCRTCKAKTNPEIVLLAQFEVHLELAIRKIADLMLELEAIKTRC